VTYNAESSAQHSFYNPAIPASIKLIPIHKRCHKFLKHSTKALQVQASSLLVQNQLKQPIC